MWYESACQFILPRRTVFPLLLAISSAVGAFLNWGLDKDLMVPFREQKQKMELNLSQIKHQIAIISGKGGVGKSTVAANLQMLEKLDLQLRNMTFKSNPQGTPVSETYKVSPPKEKFSLLKAINDKVNQRSYSEVFPELKVLS